MQSFFMFSYSSCLCSKFYSKLQRCQDAGFFYAFFFLVPQCLSSKLYSKLQRRQGAEFFYVFFFLVPQCLCSKFYSKLQRRQGAEFFMSFFPSAFAVIYFSILKIIYKTFKIHLLTKEH